MQTQQASEKLVVPVSKGFSRQQTQLNMNNLHYDGYGLSSSYAEGLIPGIHNISSVGSSPLKRGAK